MASFRRAVMSLGIASASYLRRGLSFDYTVSEEEPAKYKCHRGDAEGTDMIYWMFFLADMGWVVVEAPKTVDDREPDRQWLWANGTKKYWCKHKAVRNGWHRWTPWGGDADEWNIERRFWCKTTVTELSKVLPSSEGDVSAVEGIIDLLEPASDSDMEGWEDY